jgi:hypothetical protein
MIDMNTSKKEFFLKATILINFMVFVILMSINIYGLFQSLRPELFLEQNLRFKNKDITLSQNEFVEKVKKQENETNIGYSTRLTKVIADGMAHIHWEKYSPDKFNQIVPFWENYILYIMGKLKITPEYERYHFSDPNKSIERGIGVCGDASMLLSQLLDKQRISNKIISLPGHVMVEVNSDGSKLMLDPDYGVVLKHSAEFYNQHPNQLGTSYSSVGYPSINDQLIINLFQHKYQSWNGVKHFITKKYYFEKLAYFLKWFLPFGFLGTSIFLLKCTKKGNQRV